MLSPGLASVEIDPAQFETAFFDLPMTSAKEALLSPWPNAAIPLSNERQSEPR